VGGWGAANPFLRLRGPAFAASIRKRLLLMKNCLFGLVALPFALALALQAQIPQPPEVEPKANVLSKFPDPTIQPGQKLVLKVVIPLKNQAHYGVEASGWIKSSVLKPSGEALNAPYLIYSSAGTIIAPEAGEYQFVFENTTHKSIRLKFPKDGRVLSRPPKEKKPEQ